ELSSDVTLTGGKTNTIFFAGDAGALVPIPPQDNHRRIAGQSTITFYDAAPGATSVEILHLPPGTDPPTVPILVGTFASLNQTIAVGVPPDNYEISLRTYNSTTGAVTVVGGPLPLTAADKGLYEIFLSNDPNGTSIDMKLIAGSP